jgi:hypothetical protein
MRRHIVHTRPLLLKIQGERAQVSAEHRSLLSASQLLNSGANTSATMLMSLIRMFMLGPVVSLNGSPTVSPTTAALWTSLPLPPSCPSSMYFLAFVPCAARVRHHQPRDDAHAERACQGIRRAPLRPARNR